MNTLELKQYPHKIKKSLFKMITKRFSQLLMRLFLKLLYLKQILKQMLWIVVATVLGAIISQFGDLAASDVKRYYDQKDYGYILPGHGGILDRCDSLLFVAPIIYMVVMIVQSTI